MGKVEGKAKRLMIMMMKTMIVERNTKSLTNPVATMMITGKRRRRRKIRIVAESERRMRRGNIGGARRRRRERFREIGVLGMRRQEVTRVADTSDSDSPC